MKNKGITLVVLVVTIIIMLILAGVTLNLAMGDNGLFTKTKDIAKKYEDASKQEENDLNHLSGILKNHIEITPSEPIETYTITYNLNRKNDEKTVTQTKKFGIDIEILGTEETKENYEFLGWASSIEKLDEGIVEYKKGDKYSKNEDLTLYAIWGKKILTAEDIGKQVKYDIDLDGVKENYDWKIFYQGKTEDGEANGRIFIIASDFVPSNIEELITATNSSNANIATINKLGRRWSSLPSIPQTMKKNNLFMENKYPLNSSKTNANARAVSTLLNTDNWETFLDKENGEYAIGGPTLEMWCAAWNTLIPESGTDENGFKKIEAIVGNATSDTGYKLKSGGVTNTGTYVSGTTTQPQNYKILSTIEKYKVFFSHTENENITANGIIDTCPGYFLASPNAKNNENLMSIVFRGDVAASTYHSGGCGLRPLVCLYSETKLIWNEIKKVYTLSK